jgi:glycosyltransferase involved in cell wall biosynthesis
MPVRVSIVIPTYKSAEWVEETLESVMRQTYPAEQLEVIVVDDASPDDSADVASRFLAKQSIKSQVVRHQKNAGAPANRNSGWKLASGDWIQFLDADDLLAPHKIQIQAEKAASAEAEVAVIYSSWQHYLLEDGKWGASGSVNAPFVDDDPVLQILQQNTFGYVGPTLIRKSMLERVSGFLERPNIGEDTDLMFRMAIAGGRFRQARSAQAAFLYRQSPNSLWRAYIKNPVAMRNLLLTLRSAEEFLRARGELSEPARTALVTRYSAFADLYFEYDRKTYWELKGWLNGLGVERPVPSSRSLGLLSSLIGFENAVRCRSAYRRLRRPEP